MTTRTAHHPTAAASNPTPIVEHDTPLELLRSLAMLPTTIQRIAARESLTPELRLAAIVAYAESLATAIAHEAAA